MRSVTRREVIQQVATTGAAVLTASAAGATEPAVQKQKLNTEPPVHSKASPDNHGPREMFAVVDREGNLKRGMHVVSTRRLDLGAYEVIFIRDVRRGVYLATPGGHGYEGIPLPATASAIGRASDPRGVLVYTTDMQGDPLATGFHLLVVCPDGYA